MKLSSRQVILVAAAATVVWLVGFGLTGRAAAQANQPAPQARRQTAGEVYKNVTTSTLKGLTVDDFLGTMGVISAALGVDCSDCHRGAGYAEVNWEFDTPKKLMARKMIEMVAVINRTNFGPQAQVVTCWTCHHGRDVPSTTITLDRLYGTPNDEKDDLVPQGTGQPTADQVFDRYIEAVGGAQRLAGLTSYIATGTSLGYEQLGGGGRFQIFAKAPDQRTTLIEYKDTPGRDDSVRSYNGRAGWQRVPRAALGQYELTGGELDGARMDALLSFPGQIKQSLTNVRVGYPELLNDRQVQIVQGSGPKGLLVTLYFDRQTGLLTRMVRSYRTPIGRAPTQIDYADYRDVGGIKFPFQYTFSWLDGKDAFQLSEVKMNVPIDAARFDKPPGK